MPIDFKPLKPLPNFRPYPNITPYTDRDGDTHAKVLELLLKYVNELAVMFNENLDAQNEMILAQLNEAQRVILAALAEQTATNAELNAELRKDVADAIASVINASIELNDEIMAGVVNKEDSETRELLNALYDGVMTINGLKGDVTIGTVKQVPNSIPMRGSDGALPGIAEPGRTDEAVNLGYLNKVAQGLSDKLRMSVRSVEEFGAVGDGVTDDTAAFQRCADAVPGGYMTLVPGKNYVLPGFVHLKSGTQVWGYGATITKPETRSSVAFFAIRTGKKKGYGAGGSDIGIYGVRTVGRANWGESATLLSAHHGSNIRVQDCTGILSVARGHWIDLNGCNGVVVSSCHLYGAAIVTGTFPGEAIQVDLSVEGSMSQVEDSPEGYDGLPSINVTVEDSSFNTYSYGGTTYPAPVAYGSHTSPLSGHYRFITMRNCYVGPTQARSSGVRGAVHFISVRDLTVEGCTFVGTGVNVELLKIQPGYDGTIDSRTVKVVGNTFWDGGATQLSLEAGDGIVVTGNSFEGYGGSPSTDYVHGIGVGTVVNAFAIGGNIFRSNSSPHATSRGVYLNAGERANEGTMFGNYAQGAAPGYGGSGNTNGRVTSVGNIG